MEKQRVLVVEDDPDIVTLVRDQLHDLGLVVTHAGNGMQGLELAREGGYALMLLDAMLPELGGFELCRRVREFNKSVPIMMLTGRSEVIDRVLGLEAGADDYLTKPFDVLELNARVRALLRRSGVSADAAPPTGGDITFKDLVIDNTSRQVTLRGTPIELTRTEYEILSLLASNQGRVLRREELLQNVWDSDLGQYEDNVTAHMSRLRRKLGKYEQCIVTVRGIGYRFVREDEWKD